MQIAAIIAAAVLAALTCNASTAQAAGPDPFDDATKLLQTDVEAALAAFEVLVAKDDFEAMNMVASILMNAHEPTPEARTRALALWETSVRHGSDAARVNYATHLLLNEEAADDARAVAMLEEVRQERVRPHVAYPLGRAYLFGQGVEQDLTRGSTLMAQAVEASPGNMDAQFLLGRAYRNGWGVPVDSPAAYRHLKLAADGGDPRALWNVGMMLLEGEGVVANPPLARRYVQQAAETGYGEGMVSMAVMLALGQGGPVDASEARVWYRRAAESGSAHALRGLGMMLITGEGGPVDTTTGAAYVEMAGKAGDPAAGQLLEMFAAEIGRADRSRVEAIKDQWMRDFGTPQ